MASYDDPIINAAIYSDLYYDTSKYYTGSFRYRLESPLGNVLQRGEVSEKPDGTPSLIYINRLCEPYLSMELDPTKTGLTSHPDASKKFWLLDDETGLSACTYTPIRMYSGYAPCETGRGGHFVPGEKILSDPIRPNVSKEMSLPFTVFSEFGGYINTDISKYYFTFCDVPPFTPSECERTVPAQFNDHPDTIPAGSFYGRMIMYPTTNLDLVYDFPRIVLTNNDGLIRTIYTQELPGGGPYTDHNYDTGRYYIWSDYSGSGPGIIYNGGFKYLYFFVTPNNSGVEREATFEFYLPSYLSEDHSDQEWLSTLKIIQPAN
jgi:hypothetical protein